MAIQSVKKSPNRNTLSWRIPLHWMPLATRRCAASLVEVSLVVASALVPYSIGLVAKSQWASDSVPLNPMLATTEEAVAKTLGIPRRESNQLVAPLTNLFWCGALIAPVVVGGWQLYLLGKKGKTHPKHWFGVQVVTASEDTPGLFRAVVREGVGRWGLPVGTAYLIWRYSGAFPDLGILLGLAGVMLLGEVAVAIFHTQRRTLHDHIAGTYVVDAAEAWMPYVEHSASSHPYKQGNPVRLEVQNSWADFDEEAEVYSRRHATVTTIVLTSQQSSRWQSLNLWQWMLQHPGTTLLIVVTASMISVLGTFVGTQIYIQSQANWRDAKNQNNKVFLALVSQLSRTSPNALEERRSAILALARLEDSRAVPFLVDLLGQEKMPALIEATQQALVSTGPESLPALQRLNLSLRKDEALRQGSKAQEQQLIALRIYATQRAIAKILALYSSQIHNADLSRVDLGRVTAGPAQFTLVLDKADLSGIQFKGTIMTRSSLRGTHFYGLGEDGRLDTFDDWIADLSGADLKEANLTGAILTHVTMNRTNLIRATLNRADLSETQLVGANLSSAKLIGADLSQAILENASLTGADLGDANLTQATLTGARLGKVSAVGTQLSFADLSQSDWQGAEMTGANFKNANLKNANLSSTNLVGANFSQAQLQNAKLRNADLSSADLRGAKVAGVDFQGTIFAAPKRVESDQFIQGPPSAASSARLKGVDFSQAKNLNAKQIDQICSQGGRHPQCSSTADR